MAARAPNRLLNIIPVLVAVVALGGCATVIDSSGARIYLPWSANQPLHPEWNLNFPRESLRLPPSPRPDPLPERKHYENWKDLSEYALAPSTPPAAGAIGVATIAEASPGLVAPSTPPAAGAIGVADNASCVASCNSSLETALAAAHMDARDSRSVIRR